MARYTWLAMLALIAATAGPTTYAADTTDVQAITKIEKEWVDAIKTKNKAFFEKYMSEDYSVTASDGVFSSGRAAYIDALMNLPKIVEATDSDQRITVHGTTGVVTGRLTLKASTGVTVSNRYIDVFAKDADGWKVIAGQDTTAK